MRKIFNHPFWCQFAERWCCMWYHCINWVFLPDRFQNCFIKHRWLIFPIEISGKRRIVGSMKKFPILMMILFPLLNSWHSVNWDSPSHSKNCFVAGFSKPNPQSPATIRRVSCILYWTHNLWTRVLKSPWISPLITMCFAAGTHRLNGVSIIFWLNVD